MKADDPITSLLPLALTSYGLACYAICGSSRLFTNLRLRNSKYEANNGALGSHKELGWRRRDSFRSKTAHLSSYGSILLG